MPEAFMITLNVKTVLLCQILFFFSSRRNFLGGFLDMKVGGITSRVLPPHGNRKLAERSNPVRFNS